MGRQQRLPSRDASPNGAPDTSAETKMSLQAPDRKRC